MLILKAILKFLKKFWWVPVLAALVFIVFFYNLFGVRSFFLSSEVTVKDTPLTVSDIRSVGKLTTAVYYGEVVYSWSDLYLETNREEVESAYDKIRAAYAMAAQKVPLKERKKPGKARMKQFKKEKLEKGNKKIYRKLRKEAGFGMNDLDFLNVIVHLSWSEFEKQYPGAGQRAADDAKMELSEAQSSYNYFVREYKALLVTMPLVLKPNAAKQRVKLFKKDFLNKKANLDIKLIYEALLSVSDFAQNKWADEDFLEYALKTNWNAFFDHYEDKINSDVLSKKPKKKELVYLGRGWVRCGFDLEKIHTLPAPDSNGVVTLRGMDPYINSYINPWFIPELEIPGFEVLKFDQSKWKKQRFTFEQISRVKQGATHKLKMDAISAKIPFRAQESAERTLTAMFKQIPSTAGDTITAVKIEFSPGFELDLTMNEFEYEFLRDGRIDSTEVEKLNNWLGTDFRDPRVDGFIKDLEVRTSGASNSLSWNVFLQERDSLAAVAGDTLPGFNDIGPPTQPDSSAPALPAIPASGGDL